MEREAPGDTPARAFCVITAPDVPRRVGRAAQEEARGRRGSTNVISVMRGPVLRWTS
jgi:hypothetical protein